MQHYFQESKDPGVGRAGVVPEEAIIGDKPKSWLAKHWKQALLMLGIVGGVAAAAVEFVIAGYAAIHASQIGSSVASVIGTFFMGGHITASAMTVAITSACLLVIIPAMVGLVLGVLTHSLKIRLAQWFKSKGWLNAAEWLSPSHKAATIVFTMGMALLVAALPILWPAATALLGATLLILISAVIAFIGNFIVSTFASMLVNAVSNWWAGRQAHAYIAVLNSTPMATPDDLTDQEIGNAADNEHVQKYQDIIYDCVLAYDEPYDRVIADARFLCAHPKQVIGTEDPKLVSLRDAIINKYMLGDYSSYISQAFQHVLKTEIEGKKEDDTQDLLKLVCTFIERAGDPSWGIQLLLDEKMKCVPDEDAVREREQVAKAALEALITREGELDRKKEVDAGQQLIKARNNLQAALMVKMKEEAVESKAETKEVIELQQKQTKALAELAELSKAGTLEAREAVAAVEAAIAGQEKLAVLQIYDERINELLVSCHPRHMMYIRLHEELSNLRNEEVQSRFSSPAVLGSAPLVVSGSMSPKTDQKILDKIKKDAQVVATDPRRFDTIKKFYLAEDKSINIKKAFQDVFAAEMQKENGGQAHQLIELLKKLSADDPTNKLHQDYVSLEVSFEYRLKSVNRPSVQSDLTATAMVRSDPVEPTKAQNLGKGLYAGFDVSPDRFHNNPTGATPTSVATTPGLGS